MRIAVPDYISNSYFPAIAAVELGFLREEGVDAEIELLFPVTDAANALREGRIDLLAGAAHAPMYASSRGRGMRLIAALSKNMYWFLVVNKHLPVHRGGWTDLHGLRIGAAPGPDIGLLHALREADVDPQSARIEIGPVPTNSDTVDISFGVSAAKALADGTIDGFWANGMGAEVAVQEGVGKVVVDARRDGGANAALTFPALMATENFLAERPREAAAAVRAVVRAQEALRNNPGLAAELGERLYPPLEGSLISTLIERDSQFYDAEINEEDIAGLNRLGLGAGLISAPTSYEDFVATEYAEFWSRAIIQA